MSISTAFSYLRRLLPATAAIQTVDRLRVSAGAMIGILATGIASTIAVDHPASLPLLIAPMGASAVLLFAAPNSPLAQPWSILGGNAVAAFIGVTCALMIPDTILAASVAVALAIGIMLILRCLHPPSGAVALTAVLGGPAITASGYWFVLSPVILNSVILLGVALIFNNATGRRYPHLRPRQDNPHGTADPAPMARLGVATEDLQAVLDHYGEIVDISVDELDSLIHQAQIRSFNRRSGEITCGEIMSRDVATVGPETSLRQAWRRLRDHRLKALPVVTESDGLVGIVTQTDFLNASVLGDDGRMRPAWHGKLLRIVGIHQDAPRTVADIMTKRVQSALPETMIARLVPPMADMGLHHMPVVDADNRIVGIVTQSDLIAALFQRRLEQPDTQDLQTAN